MVKHFLAQMARHAATRGMTSLSFCQGTGKSKSIGFLETLRHPIQQKKLKNSRKNMKSQTKNKKNRSILLIPTLNKSVSYQFLIILLLGQIMSNHHKIISLHVVIPLYSGFFLKNIFSQQFRRRVARLSIFMGKSRH